MSYYIEQANRHIGAAEHALKGMATNPGLAAQIHASLAIAYLKLEEANAGTQTTRSSDIPTHPS